MHLLQGLINFIVNKAKLIIVLTFGLTILFSYFIITSFKVDTNFGHIVPNYNKEKYVSNNSLKDVNHNLNKIVKKQNKEIPKACNPLDKVIIDQSKDQSNLEKNNITGAFYLIVSSTDLFRPDFLTDLEKVIKILESQKELRKSYSIFDYVSLVKDGSRLKIENTDPHEKGKPWNKKEALEFKKRVENDTMIKNTLVSSDSTSFLFSFPCSEASTQRIEEIKSIAKPLEQYGVKLSYSGTMIMNERLLSYLTKDTITLVILCFIVIIIIFYLSFRNLRGVILPFLVSVVSLIWTLGSMSILNFPLTVVSFIVLPLVLVLGSCYSIHVLNEYYVVLNEFSNGKQASIKTLKNITKIIILACLTTGVNFLSLLFTDLPSFTQFSISCALGVVYTAVLSLTFLPAVLSLLKKSNKTNIVTKTNTIFNKAIIKNSEFVIKKYIFILLFVLVIIVFYIFSYGKVRVDSNYMNYLPSNESLVKDTRFLSQEIGGVEPYYIVLYSPDGQENYFNQIDVLEKVFKYEAALLNNCDDITQITSYASYLKYALHILNKDETKPNKALVNVVNRMKKVVEKSFNNDQITSLLHVSGNSITLYVQHYDSVYNDASTITSSKRIENTFIKYLDILPKGVKMIYGGTPSVFVKLSDSIIKGQNKALILSLIFVLVLSIFIFKSFGLALASIIPVSIAVMINYLLMYVFNLPLDMITISISSITIGVGIDDSIHFLLRYKKNKKLYSDICICVEKTLLETSRPILVTSISIICGMLMLVLSSFIPIKIFGILISFALVSTTLGALIVLPSCILLFDKIKRRMRKV